MKMAENVLERWVGEGVGVGVGVAWALNSALGIPERFLIALIVMKLS